VRLQKFLARAGVASRRASERLISAGRVRVDGEVITRLGTSVVEGQVVEVDGEVVAIPTARWLAVHKPPGTLCTRHDPQGRPTVYDLLPADAEPLFHVGRLDYMSEGLLLMTNDGDLANSLLHPSARLRRRYEVALVGPAPEGLPAGLVAGVELEDGHAAAAEAGWIVPASDPATVIRLTLLEGRNREIRRLLKAFDVRVRWLRRVAFGPIELGDLGRGESRQLTDEEVERLRRSATGGARTEK